MVSDIRLRVSLNCVVAGELLADCEGTEPTPAPFLAAALQAARDARIAGLDGDGRATEARPIGIVVNFRLPTMLGVPVAVDPPPARPMPATIVAPSWLELPDAIDFSRRYPPEARRAGVNGRAVLDCLVATNGRIACTVVSEEPTGHGFGEAALLISRNFRMAPSTRDGRPTAGGRIRLPIRFAIARPPAQDPPSPPAEP